MGFKQTISSTSNPEFKIRQFKNLPFQINYLDFIQISQLSIKIACNFVKYFM